MGTSVQAGLEEGVVSVHVVLVEYVGCQIVIDQTLPWDRETEDVETILVGKMLHLAGRHLQAGALVLAVVCGLWTVVPLMKMLKLVYTVYWARKLYTCVHSNVT